MGLFDKLQQKVQDKLQNAIPENLVKSIQEKTLAAFPKGVFDSLQAKGMQDMERTISMEGVDDLEKRGVDVTELRQKVAERIAREEAEAAARVYKLGNLKPYLQTPRSPADDFYKDATAHPPLLGREAWRNSFIDAPIVYAAVVQAHSDLWEPGDDSPKAAVFVFSPAPARRCDCDWLRDVAAKVSEMKNAVAVPEDCKNFIYYLRNDSSTFCFRIGSSLVGNEEAWCATYAFDDPTLLPFACLPNDRIVPFFLLEEPKQGIRVSFGLVPAKYLV